MDFACSRCTSTAGWPGSAKSCAGPAAFSRAAAGPELEPLVVLTMPLGNLYRDHWSITGHEVPRTDQSDEMVYLPGATRCC